MQVVQHQHHRTAQLPHHAGQLGGQIPRAGGRRGHPAQAGAGRVAGDGQQGRRHRAPERALVVVGPVQAHPRRRAAAGTRGDPRPGQHRLAPARGRGDQRRPAGQPRGQPLVQPRPLDHLAGDRHGELRGPVRHRDVPASLLVIRSGAWSRRRAYRRIWPASGVAADHPNRVSRAPPGFSTIVPLSARGVRPSRRSTPAGTEPRTVTASGRSASGAEDAPSAPRATRTADLARIG